MALSLIVYKMAIIMGMSLIGFAARRSWKTNEDMVGMLTRLCMDILSPCMILHSAFATEMILSIGELLAFIGLSALSIFLMYGFSILFVKLMKFKDDYIGIGQFAITFSNAGFFGIPIIDLVYGVDGIFYTSIYLMVLSILVFSLGPFQLMRGKKEEFDWKGIFTAPMVAGVIGIILFLFKASAPAFVTELLGTVGSAMSPVSMLLIGISIGGMNFREAFGGWRAYIISFMRLTAAPFIVWLVLRLFMDDPMRLNVIVLCCGFPVAIALLMLSARFGRDDKVSAKIILISTVMSTATIPMMLLLLR